MAKQLNYPLGFLPDATITTKTDHSMPDADIIILTQTPELTEFCTRAAKFPFITIDTEFIRERTYYPKLCLIQIATDDEAVIIDPLAGGIDLTPLVELLNNEAVLKVFHAARQDLEIFYHMTGKVPHPVFDTQVAAMVCGFGESISYDGLVQQLAGAHIDKSARFTNWNQRPLTEKQLHYARSDVTYLRTVYAQLDRKLNETERTPWIREEMAVLTSAETYAAHPEHAWKRMKLRSKSPKFIAVVQAVAEWRERMAQKIDVPRTRILKDESITDIAASTPKSLDDLYRRRGMNKGLDKGLMEELLKVADKAKDTPKKEVPVLPQGKYIPPTANATIELLRVLLKRQCDKMHVAQKLVATRDELELTAIGKLHETHLSHGWRWEVFGKYAADLLKGELGLALDPNEGSVVLLTHDDMAPE